MKRTKIISFPRSGHSLVAMILSNYFGQEFKYCERYVNPELVIEKNSETNIQKEHDFELNTIYEPSLNYIIQIRNPLYAIPSWYSLIKKERRDIDWSIFSVHSLEFWNNFLNKWIPTSKQHNIPIIYYEDLILKPKENLIKIISTIKTTPINHDLLDDCIKRENIKQRPSLFVPGEEWNNRVGKNIIKYESLKNE